MPAKELLERFFFTKSITVQPISFI